MASAPNRSVKTSQAPSEYWCFTGDMSWSPTAEADSELEPRQKDGRSPQTTPPHRRPFELFRGRKYLPKKTYLDKTPKQLCIKPRSLKHVTGRRQVRRIMMVIESYLVCYRRVPTNWAGSARHSLAVNQPERLRLDAPQRSDAIHL